ncbi:MAG: adenylate/guanylate cyclase domain-containing protein [Pseudomonadota bacterium]
MLVFKRILTLLHLRSPEKTALFLAALALAALELLSLHWLTPAENRLLDLMVRHHAATLAPDPDIVIVNIDDASLAHMEGVAGAWPWPRSVHGDLIEGMRRQSPRAIVFDISFVERDVYRSESDKLFNDALAGSTNIYFPLIRQDNARLNSDAIAALKLQRNPKVSANGGLAVLPPQAVDLQYWRTGTINLENDDDGIYRHYDLYRESQGWILPSMPARVAADLGYAVPRQEDMLLAWRGRKNGFRAISYADLYEDFNREHPKRPPNELTGKIVIIGNDASGMNDLRPTPLASQYAGAQIMATAIDNLKNGRIMRTPPAWLIPGLVLLAFAITYWSFLRGANVLKAGAALLMLSAATLAATYWAIVQLTLIPTISALTLIWAYYFAGALQAYFAERKTRQRSIEMFSRFVNPHVVQQLMTHGGVLRSGESRDISVLFSDIRGFTTLSESRTPQAVVDLLNRYFTLQVEVVFRHGGSLDKFIGDCIMAFWGAPLDDPEHAQHAVQAALEMAEVLQRFKVELGAQDLDFDVGIGIHSGPAVVGLIGSDQRREYTAIGDTVNLASRIEGLTKGVARILVSDETMKRCSGMFKFIPHGAFEVKGREQKVNLYCPEKGDLQ